MSVRDKNSKSGTAGIMNRRHFLVALAGASLTSPAFGWTIDGLPENDGELTQAPRLIVGGGADSLPGEAAPLLSGPLAHGLTLSTPIATHFDLGRDGVTAANLFDTAAPDTEGATAILAPGAAIVASLAGDSRVHFDYSRWVSLMVAQRPVVTLARAELRHSIRARLAGMLHDHPVRIAVSQPTGVELASLLGLSLLGLHPVPVSGFATREDALSALQSGAVDAIQLTPGPNDDLTKDIASAPGGAAPLFHFGLPVDNVPRFEDAFLSAHGRTPAGPLYNAWTALADAAGVALALALPMLTPPLLVARWRHAAMVAITDHNLKRWCAEQHLSVSTGADSAPILSDLTPDLTALLALRRWINNNTPRWRAGQETRPT
ncbi:hypothetical protein A0U89_03770 [Kozakia baliensis]|uniref:Uncharacterized protein n=3 Tax=Kozakia baliensis TaxID=153496 RepID=A0A1D8URX0_9PROT|nr:hypothetical protein A0U89_03770 [Kozakia baliensis]GEL63541.1 hypothetical protein KBA01_08270 [Kozakia baliensis]